MPQNRIKLNNYDEVQPTEMNYSWETTSTEDSGRAMSGIMYDTPMFTVEAFDVKYSYLTIAQCKSILQEIVKRPKKPYFNLHYFSPFHGTWRTAQFGVSQGSLNVKSLKRGEETFSEISCRFVGREKLI